MDVEPDGKKEWILRKDIFLYEETEYPGHYLIGYSDNAFLNQNLDDVVCAINDVAKVFCSFLNLENVCERKLCVCYCQDSPVCVYANSMIGLSSMSFTYDQAVYQFSHELMHFYLNERIPKKYIWFEECLCALSSILVMKCLVNEQIKTGRENVIVNLYMKNNAYPMQMIDKTELKNYSNIYHKEFVHDFDFEKNCAYYIDSILKNDYDLKFLEYLPCEECESFIEYLVLWKKEVPSQYIEQIQSICDLFGT